MSTGLRATERRRAGTLDVPYMKRTSLSDFPARSQYAFIILESLVVLQAGQSASRVLVCYRSRV